MASMDERQLYAKFAGPPSLRYPFPDMVNPFMEDLAQEYCELIDRDYAFHSAEARARHKRHRLSDIAARAFPHLTLEELRPIGVLTTSGAMMDDYFDHCSHHEMYAIRERIMALLTGDESSEPADQGIYRQFWELRQHAVVCDMPVHLYDKFLSAVNDMLVGFQDEKPWIAKDETPPLDVHLVIRQSTSGGLPYAKYVCMQKNYRVFPDDVLEHPHILRMHILSARLIGHHNDITSLPKELSRKGDKINLVMALRCEHKLPLDSAYRMAIEFHNRELKEFIVLRDNLPNFGQWQSMAKDYVDDLGIMIQGVYSWHTKNSGRYVPDSYVEPEYISAEFRWV